MSDGAINSVITGRPAYYAVPEDGKTYLVNAVTGRAEFVINGDIGGGGVEVMTTAERTAITPEAGQLIYDTDEGALYVGDGETAGGIPVGSGGGGGGGTPATVTDIMTGSGASKILNVQNIRGALTAGQAVDVTSQPDGVTGDYKGTFSVTGTLGFASFPKYASGLNYLMIADLTATTSGTVTPSGTWLDGTTTAKSLAAGTSTRVAMLFNAANKAKLTFASTGSVSVSHCREYEVTACSNEAIAYIAALSNPDAFASYYLVKADMVQPWTYIINMPDATDQSPGNVVCASGLAYQIKALTGTYTITVGDIPTGYIGRDTFIRIFIGDTGNVVVQSPLVLGTPLVTNAINNCIIQYRDGEAVLKVTDTIGGYVVSVASGTTNGSLYYGLMDSATEFISIPSTFDGIPVDLGGASVATSGTAQKHVTGNGSGTLLSGTLNAGAGKLSLSNLSLSDVGITGGTLTIPDGVVASGTVNISSGASAIFSGGSIASGSIVAVSGGTIELHKALGGGTIDLGGTRIAALSGETISASGITFTNGIGSGGGAVAVNTRACEFVSCTFSGNTAPSGTGGAIYTAWNANARFVSCVITGNTSTNGGGGFCDQGVFSGCTISGNTNSDIRFTESRAVVSAVDCTLGLCYTSRGKMYLAGSNHIDQIAGASATVLIAEGAIVDVTGATANNTINPGGGIVVSGTGCTVINSGGTSVAITGGTYATIKKDGTTA